MPGERADKWNRDFGPSARAVSWPGGGRADGSSRQWKTV
ncbi:hypothetical protein OH687_36330 [Burkholderia anthina]|nr:hypothetical protein OH687_36330 [Burkholderia anthina]